MPLYLARTGVAVFAMLFALTLVTERPAAGRALAASSRSIDQRATSIEIPGLHEIPRVATVAGSETAAPVAAVPVQGVRPAAAVVAAPVQGDSLVVASWYGPGFYGNRTACGQTYTPEILGVAHLELPCGTPLTLTYGGRSITVPVIDRGRMSRVGRSISRTRRRSRSGAPTCARFGCRSCIECPEIARTLDGRPSVGMELAARPSHQAAGSPAPARVSHEGVSGCRRARAR